jgi:hypothetical protein
LVWAAGGPAVSAAIGAVALLLLLGVCQRSYQPPWSPLPNGFPYRDAPSKNVQLDDPDARLVVALRTWSGETWGISPNAPAVWLARLFWVNYFLFLINVLLVGFPLDGGRMLQAALWPTLGYRQATLTAVFAGFGVVCFVGLYAIVVDSVLALCLALFIFVSCQRQWVILETGGEEGLFGYDFSQGYTSLERDQPAPRPATRRVSWWRGWLQRRAARRFQKEMELREEEESRLDELLDKVHRLGQAALSDEERRFMKRVSDRYRKSR